MRNDAGGYSDAPPWTDLAVGIAGLERRLAGRSENGHILGPSPDDRELLDVEISSEAAIACFAIL